ncbi:MAG: alpha-amylase, partial [Anaerolineae bacterium]|nr:alpha-amylase [Anaerolineae bacterium]
MQDFTFGPLTQVEHRLTRLRQQRSGVQHRHQTLPLDPLPGQPVVVQALTGPNFPVDRVTLYYTVDGTEPHGSRGEAQVGMALAMEPAEVEWDLIDWGYLTVWRATLPPQPEGTKVIYKIGAWHTRGGLGGSAAEVFADNGAASSAGATRFALAYDTLTPPDWIWDTSLYFVFLDRFAPTPGQRFKDEGTPRGFSGGTLRGVIDKLGYIAELGANCVWLSPCFEGPTYHGYHVTDYKKVESRWGTNADLMELVRQAHNLGIRVLLDFVPNHSARQHPYFQAAQADQASPYTQWYTFKQWPHDYEMFYTARDLPKLNLEHAEARAWMIDAGRYWLEEVGIDGYRLDHAAGPSHHFWTDFRRATRAAAPDSFTVGEVVEAADTLRTYAGRLDGVLDFMFVDAARRFFAYDGLDAAQFDTFLTRHDGYFGQGLVRPTFIDNHDMNRFLFVAGNDKDRLRLAAT